MKLSKDLIHKAFFLLIAAFFAYQNFHFDVLDELLLFYLGVILLFFWSGWLSFMGGIGLGIFTLVVKKTRPELDVSRLTTYEWWLIGAGMVAILRDWALRAWQIFSMRHDHVSMYTYVLLLLRIFRRTLRYSRGIVGKVFSVRRGVRFIWAVCRNGSRVSIRVMWVACRNGIKWFTVFARVSWKQAVQLYEMVFGHFPLVVKTKIVGLLVVTMALFFFTRIPVGDVLFIVCTVAFIFFRVDSRFAFAGSILALMTVPFFLVVGQESYAVTTGIYVYYFLLIGIMVEIREILGAHKPTRL